MSKSGFRLVSTPSLRWLSLVLLWAGCNPSPLTDTSCDQDRHLCAGICASNLSTDSCGTSSCTPCTTPDHAAATCDGVACGFTCDDGYYENAGACVACSSCDVGTFAAAACHANYDTVCTTCTTCAAAQYLTQACTTTADTMCGDISAASPISSPYSSFSYSAVFSTADSTSGVFLATWADANNNQYPTYAIYTPGTGWSSDAPISTTSSAIITTNVVTSIDPTTGKFLATWTDSTTKYPTSAVYSADTGWSAADSLTTATAARNTISSFDATTGQFLVTWADSSNNDPSYAFYSLDTGWGAAASISTTSPAANIYTSFDATTDQFLAVWTDVGTGVAKYSFYAAGAWSDAASISNFSSVDNDVLCANDPSTGQFIATWADINQGLQPFYSVFVPGSGWTAAAIIDTSSAVTDNVVITCDLTNGKFLATWSNLSNGALEYTFYAPSGGWIVPALISSTGSSRGDIFIAFDSTTGEFLATWTDNSDANAVFNPSYSFFEN